MKYAKLDEYRSDLYKDLEKMKKLDKFPSQYKTQEQIARSLFLKNNSSYYNRPDTIAYVDKLPVAYKNKKGFVYFFKYKAARDDNFWMLASVGMQPEKPDSIDVNNNDFDEDTEHKLDNTKSVKEQMEKILRELLNSKRDSASEFYDSRRYNIYKTYLTDMVKGSRYRD
jgi:hypothetical protein